MEEEFSLNHVRPVRVNSMHHFCVVLRFLVTTQKFSTEPNNLRCVWMIARLFGVDFDYA